MKQETKRQGLCQKEEEKMLERTRESCIMVEKEILQQQKRKKRTL
jgi:transcriptional regulator